MNTFLITLMVFGAWNLLNFIARIYYNEISFNYSWHIIIGVWAAYLYFGGV